MTDEKLQDVRDEFLQAKAYCEEEYEKKQEDFAFVASKMYTDEEINILTNSNPPRPAYVWNKILPAINLVTGVFHQNPVRVKAEPREESDQLLADVLNETIEFIDDDIGAEGEEYEALEDAAICGSAYVRVDVNLDPKNPTEIKIKETTLPYYKVYRDPFGQRDDMKDCRYIFEEVWMSREDFKVAYPKFKDKIDEVMESGVKDATNGDILDGLLEDTPNGEFTSRTPGFYSSADDLVRVVRKQYWSAYERYYDLNGVELSPDEYKKVKEEDPEFKVIKVTDKKVKWLEFSGDFILFDDDSPIPYDGFNIVGMFWNKDKSSAVIHHFGVTRPLKDPNREVNRRWCSGIETIVSQGQGVMAEIDAFLDPRQAEDSWSDPRQITWVTKGALSTGKIKEKPGVEFPAAAMQMEKLAEEAINNISGLNPNLMGVVGNSGESGVVVKLRIQQGLTLLAKAFRNFKQLKAELFRIKAAIVMHYMPEKQIFRILGPAKKYVMEDGMLKDPERGIVAPLRSIENLKYNIKVEDAPGNINRAMAELAIYLQMVSKGIPVDPKVIIKKLDITAGEKADWIKYIEEKQQAAAKQGQAEMQVQAETAKAKNQIEQAKLQLKAKTEETKAQIEALKLALKQKKDEADLAVDLTNIQQHERDSIRQVALQLAELNQEQRAAALARIGELIKTAATAPPAANRSNFGPPPTNGAPLE